MLRVTLRSIGDAVITTDIDGPVTYLNAVAESLTGWTQAEALGRPLDRSFASSTRTRAQPVESPAIKALRDGVVVGLANHTVLIRRDGSECPIDDSAAPITDERGACVRLRADLSRRHRRSGDCEARARQPVADARVCSRRSSSRPTTRSSASRSTARSRAGTRPPSGCSATRPTEAIGRHISLVIPPDRLARGRRDRRQSQGRAADRALRDRAHARRRQPHFVSLTISPVKDDAGTVVGASKIVRDITERKRAEADREKFVTLVESSTDFIGICDLNGVPIFVNRAGLELVGLSRASTRRDARTVASFFFPEDQPRIVNEFFPSVLANGHGGTDVRFRHFKTGAARWMAYKVADACRTRTGSRSDSRPSARTSPSGGGSRTTCGAWPRICPTPIAARTSSSRCSPTSCAIRSRRSATRSQVLKSRRRRRRDRAQRGETMERQLGQLVRLVDDLLDVTRITRGKIELRRSRVELAPIVEQAVEACRPLVDAAGHRADAWHCRRSRCHPRRRPDAAGAGVRQPAQQRCQVHGPRRHDLG